MKKTIGVKAISLYNNQGESFRKNKRPPARIEGSKCFTATMQFSIETINRQNGGGMQNFESCMAPTTIPYSREGGGSPLLILSGGQEGSSSSSHPLQWPLTAFNIKMRVWSTFRQRLTVTPE